MFKDYQINCIFTLPVQLIRVKPEYVELAWNSQLEIRYWGFLRLGLG